MDGWVRKGRKKGDESVGWCREGSLRFGYRFGSGFET